MAVGLMRHRMLLCTLCWKRQLLWHGLLVCTGHVRVLKRRRLLLCALWQVSILRLRDKVIVLRSGWCRTPLWLPTDVRLTTELRLRLRLHYGCLAESSVGNVYSWKCCQFKIHVVFEV